MHMSTLNQKFRECQLMPAVQGIQIECCIAATSVHDIIRAETPSRKDAGFVGHHRGRPGFLFECIELEQPGDPGSNMFVGELSQHLATFEGGLEIPYANPGCPY